MDIKEKLEEELSTITLSENFTKELYARINQRKKRFKYKIAVCIFCILLASGTVSAGLYYYSVSLNNKELPALSPLEIKEVCDSKATPDEHGFYYETYDSYEALCKNLGIKLLNNDYSNENPYMIIKRDTNNLDYNWIDIQAYITGDITNIRYVSDIDSYKWERGDLFGSPIDMEIWIVNSEAQLQHGFEFEFLGMYEFIETYITKEGFKVNILRDTSVIEDEAKKIKPKYIAVFVADGIQYNLSGATTLETFKDILDSFHF